MKSWFRRHDGICPPSSFSNHQLFCPRPQLMARTTASFAGVSGWCRLAHLLRVRACKTTEDEMEAQSRNSFWETPCSLGRQRPGRSKVKATSRQIGTEERKTFTLISVAWVSMVCLWEHEPQNEEDQSGEPLVPSVKGPYKPPMRIPYGPLGLRGHAPTPAPCSTPPTKGPSSVTGLEELACLLLVESSWKGDLTSLAPKWATWRLGELNRPELEGGRRSCVWTTWRLSAQTPLFSPIQATTLGDIPNSTHSTHDKPISYGVSVGVCTESLQSRLALCDPVDPAHQAPLSMGFSRQEHWSGMQCVPPGGLSNPGIKPSLMSPVLTGRFFVTSATWEAPWVNYLSTITHSEPGSNPTLFPIVILIF